jgi:hypothetical protein
MPTFADIVEKVTSMEMEEMEEMKKIISQTLVEKKRALYLQQYQQALVDSKEGKLFCSSNFDEISKWLNEQ